MRIQMYVVLSLCAVVVGACSSEGSSGASGGPLPTAVASATPTVTASAAPTPAPTSAGALSIGSKVKERVSDGQVYAATVVGFYGKLVQIRDDKDKVVRWIRMSETDPPGTPLPDPTGDTCSVHMSQKVNALYPYVAKRRFIGKVVEIYGKVARVVLQDNELFYVSCDDCDPAY